MRPILSRTMPDARAILLECAIRSGYEKTVISKIFRARSKDKLLTLVMTGSLDLGVPGSERHLSDEVVEKVNNMCKKYTFIDKEALIVALEFKPLPKNRKRPRSLSDRRKKFKRLRKWTGH